MDSAGGYSRCNNIRAALWGKHCGAIANVQSYAVRGHMVRGELATSNVRFNSSYGGGGDAAIANNSFGGGHEMKENEFNLLLFVDLCSDSRIYRRAEHLLLCVLVVAFRSAGICR